MKRIIYTLIFLFSFPYIIGTAHATEWGIPVGGLNILKTSVTGEPLAGAVFQVARDLREGELTDKRIKKQFLWIGGENRLMALENFWPDRSMLGDRQSTVNTTENGKAAIYGLPYGTYYLVEQEAPSGYNRIVEPIRITIHKYSHLTESDNVRDDQNKVIDNTLHIVTVRYTLPDTGSWETVQLAAGGAGILFSSAALLLLNRRRW